MKETIESVNELYAVFSKSRSDGTITLMWIEADREEAERDCDDNTDAEYEWYFTRERVYGNVLIKKYI